MALKKREDLRSKADESDAQLSLPWRIIERGWNYIDDIVAIFLIATALVLLLGLMGLTQGSWISPSIVFIERWMGFGAAVVPITLALLGWVFLKRSRSLGFQIPWIQIIGLEIVLFILLAFLSILDAQELPRAEAGFGGGIIGWSLSSLLGEVFGRVGRIIVLGFILIVGAAIGLQSRLMQSNDRVKRSSHPSNPTSMPRGELQFPTDPSSNLNSDELRQGSTSARRLPREYRKNFQVQKLSDEGSKKADRRDPRLPPLEILEIGKTATVTSQEINLAAGTIEKTLADFGLPARVVSFKTGPTVTQFAVEPGYVESLAPEGQVRRHKVRVSQISALANDLAMALSAPRLRIEAPVPGQAYLGIEVPNRRPAVVRMRPILETDAFQRINSPLGVVLGRDVAGAAVAADLTTMPHMLIAGTTGSGKSVCIASLALCLCINNTPEDLRLVMIDPKMVELIRFNGLPHLLGKVETELERITGVLRWCTIEMDRRYRLLESARARDIEAYNRKVRNKRDAERLPRLVIMIDELADLMMMAPDQTEHTLVRLAQMARATGIHLIVATQRPSTDILTGLIKANFPARLSFAVASSIDSRVILDGPGAETLLGRGDMLFLSPEAGSPVRLKGVLVSEHEIEALIEYWQKETEDVEVEPEPVPWEHLLERGARLDDRDEIIEQAIAVVRERGEASASLLQRALRVGYPRAARLMDELEELGVIGRAQSGGKTREVLIQEGEDPLDPEPLGPDNDEDA
ncbi:MAG: DNA translocase FtsK [Anaerolineales bacterium]|nr:MAG: DNA translocase FtsK [Anaerolineales bacterium]